MSLADSDSGLTVELPVTNCPITVRDMDGAAGVVWVRVARRAACVALLIALLVFPFAMTAVAGEPGNPNGARAGERCANAAEAAHERCDEAPSDDDAEVERGHRAEASSGDRPPDVELPAAALERLPSAAIENLAS